MVLKGQTTSNKRSFEIVEDKITSHKPKRTKRVYRQYYNTDYTTVFGYLHRRLHAKHGLGFGYYILMTTAENLFPDWLDHEVYPDSREAERAYELVLKTVRETPDLADSVRSVFPTCYRQLFGFQKETKGENRTP